MGFGNGGECVVDVCEAVVVPGATGAMGAHILKPKSCYGTLMMEPREMSVCDRELGV
jgi:hypothetical protein